MSPGIIGFLSVGVTIAGVGIALAALIVRLHPTLREDFRELRRDQAGLHRVSRLEGLIEGLRDAITGRRPATEPD